MAGIVRGRRSAPPYDVHLGLLDLFDRCGRIDAAVGELLLRGIDGRLRVRRNRSGVGREQRGVGKLLDAVEVVRAALEVTVLEGLDDLEHGVRERLERARDDAIALRRLVGVDADRHLPLLASRVDRAETAVTRHLEDDVRAAGDLVERDLLALRLVDERLRIRVHELHGRIGVDDALLEARDPVVDRRDLLAADGRDALALRQLRREDAREVAGFLGRIHHPEGVWLLARLRLRTRFS